MNLGSVELTLNVWKSESSPLVLLNFELGSNSEVFSVNGTGFPLGYEDVFFRTDRRRDEIMSSHTTPSMAASVAIGAHQREGMLAAATTSINIMVVGTGMLALLFFFRDIECFHVTGLAY